LSQWQDNLAIGVLQIDIQHQLLFEKFHAFQAAHQQHETSPEELYRLFWFLQAYAQTHFAEEEELMRQIGFPGYQEHRSRHLGFTARIQKFNDQLRAEGFTQPIVTDLAGFINCWLVDHITTMDLAIGRFLAASAERQVPRH